VQILGPIHELRRVIVLIPIFVTPTLDAAIFLASTRGVPVHSECDHLGEPSHGLRMQEALKILGVAELPFVVVSQAENTPVAQYRAQVVRPYCHTNGPLELWHDGEDSIFGTEGPPARVRDVPAAHTTIL